MTHVLLTRSPLSPGPKPRFSLDLHVLSAPPAFVLSQDQTLREDWFAGPCCLKGNMPASFSLRACAQSCLLAPLSSSEGGDGFLSRSTLGRPSGLDVSRC